MFTREFWYLSGRSLRSVSDFNVRYKLASEATTTSPIKEIHHPR